jgi:hypothetical protein
MALTFILVLIIVVFLGLYVWWNVFCDKYDKDEMSDGQYAALIGFGMVALLATITLGIRGIVV